MRTVILTQSATSWKGLAYNYGIRVHYVTSKSFSAFELYLYISLIYNRKRYFQATSPRHIHYKKPWIHQLTRIPFIHVMMHKDTRLGFYVALRPRRRDNLLGTGTEWERGQGDWLDRGNRPKKTGETVDRRQNNGSVKAVSPRHCPATCALRNCSFNCCAGQSH